MARRFKNAANGHVEEVSAASAVFAGLFGLFYFAAKGIWRHVVIQLVVVVAVVGAAGPVGFFFAFVMWVIYAIAAPSIVAGNYLKNGWIEVPEDLDFNAERSAPEPKRATQVAEAPVGADERLCPFCAEPIKRVAIKCKHCSSAVEPDLTQPEQQAALTSAHPGPERTMGTCPNCKRRIRADSEACPNCFTDFSQASEWRIN